MSDLIEGQRAEAWRAMVREDVSRSKDAEIVALRGRRDDLLRANNDLVFEKRDLNAEIARLRDLIAIWRRGPVQALGAAISLQSQSRMEAAYVTLRDEMDRLAIDIALEQKP